jgi:hypothetical protein
MFVWKNDFDKQMEKRWSAPYRDISLNRMFGTHTRYFTVCLLAQAGPSTKPFGVPLDIHGLIDGRLDEWLKSESC